MDIVGVRFESLIQNERRDATVLAIGEVLRESTEAGVDAPEPGDPGRLSSKFKFKFWRALNAPAPLRIGMGAITLTGSPFARVIFTPRAVVGVTVPSTSDSTPPSVSESTSLVDVRLGIKLGLCARAFLDARVFTAISARSCTSGMGVTPLTL